MVEGKDGEEAKEEKKEVIIKASDYKTEGDSDEAKAAKKKLDQEVKIAATYAAFDDEKFQKATQKAVFNSIKPTLKDAVKKTLADEKFEKLPAKVQ